MYYIPTKFGKKLTDLNNEKSCHFVIAKFENTSNDLQGNICCWCNFYFCPADRKVTRGILWQELTHAAVNDWCSVVPQNPFHAKSL